MKEDKLGKLSMELSVEVLNLVNGVPFGKQRAEQFEKYSFHPSTQQRTGNKKRLVYM